MIIIAPYSRKTRSGVLNPKNYPYWKELLGLIKEPVIQIAIEGEEILTENCVVGLSLKELAELVKECRTWISVDSFFQHFCWDLGKPGVVIFSQSDPNIFGHKENINLLKSREYLRPNQFWLWDQTEYNKDAYVTPEEVYTHLI